MDLTPTIEPGWFRSLVEFALAPGTGGGVVFSSGFYLALIGAFVVIMAIALPIFCKLFDRTAEIAFVSLLFPISMVILFALPGVLIADQYYNLKLDEATTEVLQEESDSVYNLNLNLAEARELRGSLQASTYTGEPLPDEGHEGLNFGTIKKTIDGDLTELTLAYVDGEYVILDGGEAGEELTPLD